MRIAKVKRVLNNAIELDFGPNWGYLLVPRRSKEFKGMDLKVGDKLKVEFKTKRLITCGKNN